MIFAWEPFPQKPKLEQKTSENGYRVYTDDNGNRYASVTTFLNWFPKPQLWAWRKRVGKEEADRITRIASTRGSSLHKICEHYLKNESIDFAKLVPKELFQKIQPEIDKHITTVYDVETQLVSDIMKLAGTSDLVGEWDTVPSIIDFKAKQVHKNMKYYDDHFLQMCVYAIMVEEMYGIKIPQLVLVISFVDGDPMIIKRNKADFIALLIHKLKEYRNGKEINLVEERKINDNTNS